MTKGATTTGTRIQWLIVEMAVVFLGVYGAFILDGCREEAALEDRREQILRLLLEDFRDAAEQLEDTGNQFDQTYGGFLNKYEQGEKPTLFPIPIPAFQTVDTWSGLLSAGVLDTLDVELIRAIEGVIGAVPPMVEVAREFNAYVRDVLVPNLEADEEEFYFESGELKPKYLWYYYSLRSTRESLIGLGKSAASVAERIEQELRNG